MDKKKEYILPTIEVIELSSQDIIITTSNQPFLPDEWEEDLLD